MPSSRLLRCLYCGLFLVAAAAEAARAAAPPKPPKRSEVRRVLAEARGDGAPAASTRPLTILLLADRKDHGPGEHDYPRWQSRWALLLGGSAASTERAANLFGPDRPDASLAKGAENARVVCAQQWPDATQWATADLVVAFCYLSWTAERIEQVRHYVDRGGGLVLIHSATWTRPKPSPDVADVTGVGGFQRWRHGPARLVITRPSHPICLGLPPVVLLEDETYWPPTPAVRADRVEVLSTSEEATDSDRGVSPQPMLWTCSRGKGRVFGCVPGHYNWTFDHPYFRLAVLRGMAWAAREDPRRFDDLVLRSASVDGE